MFGTVFFLGDLLSAIISTPIIDRYGRKISFWVGRAVVIAVYLLMISLPPDFEYAVPMMYALILIFGLTQTLRRVSIFYISETMPARDHAFFVAMQVVF